MKKNNLSKVSQWVLLLTLLFTACQKDLYEGGEEITPPTTPEIEIDWSTNKTTQLQVIVDDEYDGQYFYTVEAYIGNPAIDLEAKLIVGSGQKTNSKVAYDREIVVPEIVETLFIAVTDPFKRTRVYGVAMQEGRIVYKVGNAEIESKSQSVQTRASKIPVINYEGYKNTEDLILLEGTQDVTLVTGKSYMIEAGKTYSGNIGIPGPGKVKLYVAGTLEWSGAETRMQTETELYVLNGGVVKSKGNKSLYMIGYSFIAVQNGGTFGDSSSDDNFSFTQLTNNSMIVNEGSFYAKKITRMTDKSSLYNTNTLKLDYLSTENPNKIVNKNFLEINTFDLKNAIVDNECKIVVEKLNVLANATIKLATGTYFFADNLDAKGLTLEMSEGSMWEGNKALFGGQASFVKGETAASAGYALFKVPEISLSTGGKVVTYSGKVEIACVSHPSGTGYQNYNISGDAFFTKGDGMALTEIPTSDCNGQGNFNQPEGEGDDSGNYEESQTLPYTYMFEDNWPAQGDYDMNDIVMSVNIQNITEQTKTKGVRITATLYAVGATKLLGAGFQLDGIPASAVSGSLPGQTYAVVSLFTDAHAELNVPAGEISNTFSIDHAPKTIVKEITFTQPINEVVNVNNFNLFILIDGDFKAEKWNEIHLPGFKGTDRATLSEFSTDKYVDVKTGWMWGLSVPQISFTTYPLETVSISKAYEGFEKWISSESTLDWYLNPNDSKVLVYEEKK